MVRVVIQRVKRASVTVDGVVVGAIGRGLLVLVGLGPGDDDKDLEAVCKKLLTLRLWDDESGGRWKRNVVDLNAELLLVSQFTLFGRVNKGNKPVFVDSLPPDVAKPLWDRFLNLVGQQYDKVQTGRFGEMMDVELVNDGPVTIQFDTKKKD